MKVLLISHTCQSKTEGQPRAQALGRLGGIDLCVLTPDRWKHYGNWRAAEKPAAASFGLEIQKVRWPWAGPGQFYLHYYPGLAKLLKKFQPDIIDLWGGALALVSAQAVWLRNRLLPRARIVSETEQNIDKNLPFPFERFRSYVIGNTDFAIGRSEGAIEVLRNKGYRGPAEVVPNAVDGNLFRVMDRREANADGFVVGYVGRLVAEKGLEDLVEAIRLCPQNIKLMLVGTGPLRDTLETLSRSAELSGRIHFAGAKSLEELPKLMNGFDLLALPSRTTASWKEQFGRVIIEAHACGVAVVGSNSGAIPDVVGDGGIIVPERNPAALAQAITTLAADPDRLRRMGERGRERVELQYTWTRVAERMRDIYLKVLTKTEQSTALNSGVQLSHS